MATKMMTKDETKEKGREKAESKNEKLEKLKRIIEKVQSCVLVKRNMELSMLFLLVH